MRLFVLDESFHYSSVAIEIPPSMYTQNFINVSEHSKTLQIPVTVAMHYHMLTCCTSMCY